MIKRDLWKGIEGDFQVCSNIIYSSPRVGPQSHYQVMSRVPFHRSKTLTLSENIE